MIVIQITATLCMTLTTLLQTPKAPMDLPSQIMQAIERSMLRTLWLKLYLSIGGTVLIGGWMVHVWSDMMEEVLDSSIIPFVRLFFSDPDILLSSLHDVAFGIAESIPILSLLLALGLCLFLLWTWQGVVTIRKTHRHSFLHLI